MFQTEIDECASNPCYHGGDCIEDVNGYSCDCVQGWTGDRCEDVIDNCVVLDPCQNSAPCDNAFDDYFCRYVFLQVILLRLL